MGFSPRNGQWVTTATTFPGAHTDSEGRTVGIFHAARRARVPGVDGGAEVVHELPDRVHIVGEDGNDLVEIVKQDGGMALVSLVRTPDQLDDLRPLLEADDIPRKHDLPPGTKLQP